METQIFKNRWFYLVQIMVISLVTGLFAFILLRLLSELTLFYFSYDLDIQAIIHLKGIQFLTQPTNPDWTRDTVITIYLSKPIMNLIMALAGMASYTLIRHKSQSFSYFLLWLIIFGLNNMFSTFAENGLLQTGIYEVTRLMHFSAVMMVVLVMLSFYFLYLSGEGVGKLIMLCIPHHFTREGKIKRPYFLMAYLLPWLLIFLIIFSKSGTSARIIYLFSIIILAPFLWAKGPEKEGMHLNPLPPLMWVDALSLLFYIIGIYFMYGILAAGLKLH